MSVQFIEMSHNSSPLANYSIFNSSSFIGKGRGAPVVVLQPTVSLPFDGNMKGNSIYNVNSINKTIANLEVEGSTLLSIKNHLEGNTLIQVKLKRAGVCYRTVCFIAVLGYDGSVTSNELTDSNPADTSGVSLNSSGSLLLNAINSTAEVSGLSMG